MKGYIPDFLRSSQVFVSLLDAEGVEFDQLYTNIEDVLKQFYVETATETGLALWEQMLGLSSYAGKPLDQRRSRIISKLRGMGTVTVNLIKNVAESYVYGTVEVTEHPELYSFTVKFVDPRGIPPNLDDVKAAIEEIKPAHLAVDYEFSYLVWDELDGLNTTWDQLDAHSYTWDELEVLDPSTY
ncbi:MAG: YmfQ family protein [Thermosyntropha sp.]|nr:YmfQ family protein [Thermosyntropha sp.]